MVERILKSSAYFSIFLVILVITSLVYLPKLHNYEQEKQAEHMEKLAVKDKLEHMTGLQILDYNNEKAETAEETTMFPNLLRIELPTGVSADQVAINESYINQNIDINIPGADANYMYSYPMVGSSDKIDNLTYESGENGGVVEITTDKVYEVRTETDQNYLYIDFVSPHDIYDKVVVIDAGHGGNAPGATLKGIYEKNIDLAIALQVKALFEEAGNDKIGIYFTRTDDSNPDFASRANLANNTDADLFISIHNNSTKTGRMSSINGTCVMYDEEKADQEHGTRGLAEICAEEMSSALGSRNRGITAGHEIYIIRSSNVPVALIEVGFMTNQEELAKLNSEEYQRKAAQGIYNSIMRAFEEGY